MDINQEIGNRIRGLREALGLSKSELGRRCNVTTTAVWNWEKHGRLPRSDTFALAAKALGVSEAFLRTGTDVVAPQVASPAPARTVAVIIDEARTEIAGITGVAFNNVHLNVEFLSH